jgi:hypothetical protein
MKQSENWTKRIEAEVYPRIKKFSKEQKRFYEGITPEMIYPEEAISKLSPQLTKDEIQFVWDTACWRENFENNRNIALIYEKQPKQIRGLGEYI